MRNNKLLVLTVLALVTGCIYILDGVCQAMVSAYSAVVTDNSSKHRVWGVVANDCASDQSVTVSFWVGKNDNIVQRDKLEFSSFENIKIINIANTSDNALKKVGAVLLVVNNYSYHSNYSIWVSDNKRNVFRNVFSPKSGVDVTTQDAYRYVENNNGKSAFIVARPILTKTDFVKPSGYTKAHYFIINIFVLGDGGASVKEIKYKTKEKYIVEADYPGMNSAPVIDKELKTIYKHIR